MVRIKFAMFLWIIILPTGIAAINKNEQAESPVANENISAAENMSMIWKGFMKLSV